MKKKTLLFLSNDAKGTEFSSSKLPLSSFLKSAAVLGICVEFMEAYSIGKARYWYGFCLAPCEV